MYAVWFSQLFFGDFNQSEKIYLYFVITITGYSLHNHCKFLCAGSSDHFLNEYHRNEYKRFRVEFTYLNLIKYYFLVIIFYFNSA